MLQFLSTNFLQYMKIHLITGATGFIGRYLTEKLLTDGATVWIVVRKQHISKVDTIFPLFGSRYKGRFKVIVGDLIQPSVGISKAPLEQLSEHEIHIWHLGANLSFSNKDKDNVYYTNTLGTKNIVKLANTIGSRLYFMSTAYVWGDRKAECLEEELEKNQKHRNMYELSKFEAEKIIRKQCEIPYIIFRPSIVIGNTYQGKALGCTFGYYRYTHLFYFLKSKIITSLQTDSLFSKVLKIFGTKYEKNKDTLQIPWCMMPYPLNATVDLIPIDYLINAIIHLAKQKESENKTFHLTNPHPPQYIFLLKSVTEDLKITEVKYIGVSKSVFNFIFKSIYYLIPRFQKYTRSILWYLPYITHKNIFIQKNVIEHVSLQMPVMTREYLRAINEYAREKIYKKITL